MPYSPNVGPSENNSTPDPQIGITSAVADVSTVLDPNNSATVQDGAKTLKDATLVVVGCIALLWGAVLGLKL